MNRLARVARNPWARGGFVLALLAAALAAIWWRGPDWGDGLRLVRRRLLALGVGRCPPEPRLGARAVALLAPHDRPGPARAAPVLRPRVLRLRSRAARERGAPGPRRRARARRRPAPASASRKGDERNPARDRLRTPSVRPLPRGVPRHLGVADGQDSALGRDEPRHLRPRGDRPAGRRIAVRQHGRGARRTTAWEACARSSSWRGKGSRSCEGRSPLWARRSSSAPVG